MGAFPPSRNAGSQISDGDPILDLARRFAIQRGAELPSGSGGLGEVWEALIDAGVDHPGLAFADWAATALLGGVFPTILVNSPTFGAFLDRLRRFHPLFGRDEVVLGEEGPVTWVSLRAVDGGPAHPESVDAFFRLVAWLTARLGLDGTGAPRVTLRRGAPDDPDVYRVLAADVCFAAAEDRCIFGTASLLMPVERADAVLLAAVEPYAERRLAQLGKSAAGVVADLVSADLESLPTLASVARRLAMSPRALQLRLAEEGTSFSAIVDGAQRDLSLTLLTTTDIPVGTVATSVGFSSPAVLSRAVRRWTGQSPSEYRRAHSVFR